VALIDLAAIEAFFEECPDGFVVLSAEREVAATPFGPAELFDQLMSRRGDGCSGRGMEGDVV
jgi:hypothetical protein